MPVVLYKRVEEEVAKGAVAALRSWWTAAAGGVERFLANGKRRFTVMLVPHSMKKISTFEISFFTFVFAALVLGIVVTGAVALASGFHGTSESNRRLLKERNESSAALAGLKDQIAALRSPARRFKDGIDAVLAAGRRQTLSPHPTALVATGAPWASYPATKSGLSSADAYRELSELKTLGGELHASADSVGRTAGVLSALRDLMAATPTTWPVKGGYGVITTRFGWTTNPFTNQGYMHLGVDIAWALGTPIVATADGTILQVGRTADLGNFVTIQHRYGYSTRYSHLNAFADKRPGDRVNRGEVIGYLGSTGLSTGPHVDYVVRLGSSYVNPIQFLAIRPENSLTLGANRVGGD